MKRLILLLAACAVTLTTLVASTPILDQATVRPGARLSQLHAGQHVYGSRFDPREHLGEIVVVNIGGG